jgi:hypothetical protein
MISLHIFLFSHSICGFHSSLVAKLMFERLPDKKNFRKHHGVDFINILRAHFSYKILAPKITKLCFGFEIFWRPNIGKKNRAK